MIRAAPAVLALALTFASPAFAQRPPAANFTAHPAGPAYTGPARQPDFAGADKPYAAFRTRLSAAARERANFAGKYVVTQIGCGTGCNNAYVIDKSTGHILAFPLRGEANGELNLSHKPTSTLIVAQWRSPQDDRCWTEEFVLKDNAFTKLRGSSRPGPGCG